MPCSLLACCEFPVHPPLPLNKRCSGEGSPSTPIASLGCRRYCPFPRTHLALGSQGRMLETASLSCGVAALPARPRTSLMCNAWIARRAGRFCWPVTLPLPAKLAASPMVGCVEVASQVRRYDCRDGGDGCPRRAATRADVSAEPTIDRGARRPDPQGGTQLAGGEAGGRGRRWRERTPSSRP
jgi:hypothetical protein